MALLMTKSKPAPAADEDYPILRNVPAEARLLPEWKPCVAEARSHANAVAKLADIDQQLAANRTKRVNIEEDARLFLAGGDLTDAPVLNNDAEIRRLSSARAIVERAIAIASEQVEKSLNKLGVAFVESKKPEYRVLALNLGRALLKAQQATEELNNLRLLPNQFSRLRMPDGGVIFPFLLHHDAGSSQHMIGNALAEIRTLGITDRELQD
jgi:hypothetical protein